MSLFAKKKENQESKDAQEVKSASSSKQTPPPFNNPTENNQHNNQDFVNPFATKSQEPTQQPQGNPAPANPQQTPHSYFDSQGTNPQQPNSAQQPSPFSQPQSATPTPQPTQGEAQIDEEHLQELIDESVEKIVQERWEKVTANVEKVVSWKGKVEQEINMMKEDIMTIKNSFETFEKRLMNKISSYDKNILDVNSEIKALDKVFQKITPTLVNNVNELSRIADDFRGVKHKSKEDNKDKEE